MVFLWFTKLYWCLLGEKSVAHEKCEWCTFHIIKRPPKFWNFDLGWESIITLSLCIIHDNFHEIVFHISWNMLVLIIFWRNSILHTYIRNCQNALSCCMQILCTCKETFHVHMAKWWIYHIYNIIQHLMTFTLWHDILWHWATSY